MSGQRDSAPSTPQAQSSAPQAAPDSSQSSQTAPVTTPDSHEDRYAQEMKDFEDAIRFDPFADGSKPGGAGAASATGAPRQEPAAASPPSTQTAPTAPNANTPAPTPASQPDPIAALQQAAERLGGAADRLQQPQAPSQQVTPQKDEEPNFLYDVPPQLMEALNSQDPAQRAAGVQYLVAGTAKAAYQQAKRLVDEFSKAVPNIVAQHIQAHTYRENVRRDFYGKYPQLDNPHLAPTVASVSQAVMQRLVASGQRPNWSPQVADLIAQEVFKLIPGLQGASQAAPRPAAPQVVPQAQPPAIFTNGSRPAMPDNGANSASAMEDLILLGRQ